MSLSWILFLSLVALSFQACTNNYYTYDGSCNNVANPDQGVAHGIYRRGPEGAEPGDITVTVPVPGQDYKLYSNRPNERDVSNQIIAQNINVNVPNTRKLNLISVLWGQLLTHDLTRAARPTDSRSNVAINDPNDFFLFNRDGTRKTQLPATPVISVRRSGGRQVNGLFEPHNEISGWLDAGFLYGTTESDNNILRGPKVDGKIHLKRYTIDYSKAAGFAPDSGARVYTEDNLWKTVAETGLPLDVANIGQNTSHVFASGDTGVSENMILFGLQLVFAREHNRNAEVIKLLKPKWTDEQIFQKARIITTALYQKITYDEYLPTVWGEDNFNTYIGKYTGYNKNIDGSTGQSFATAAMRTGHSTVKQNLTMYDGCGNQNFSLGFNGVLTQTAQPVNADPAEILGLSGGFTNILQAAIFDKAEEGDNFIGDTLRNILIAGNATTGIDVSVSNIRRGRIHSIPNFNTLRQQYHPLYDRKIYGTEGCPAALETSTDVDPLPCFLRFISSATLANKVRDLYKKVNLIDPYVGLLLEKKSCTDCLFGKTGTSIVLDQFKRSRDGDRFYWENLSLSQLSLLERLAIRSTSLKEVIKRNDIGFPVLQGGILTINDNAFLIPERPSLLCLIL